MKEIRLHGRGGQGAVTAASILAVAAFLDGKYTQAFPTFGVERRGAPVQAFVRISDRFIRRRDQIYEPDALLVFDPTLFKVVDVKGGLKEGGMVIINTNKTAKDFGLEGFDVKCLDVTKDAFEVLGRDIVNTAILGAFAAYTGDVTKESICAAVKEQFPPELAEKNIKLVEKVYEKAGSN
ncbi:MAG: pyruvate ferredoxin oxidoreductase subunit gamma [Candidatus Altiarchaeota archaeon]|nr:pyruvate ferredoxin oxidoreductase subunit gamma [Candidatus Altiarchaeota archaeon]